MKTSNRAFISLSLLSLSLLGQIPAWAHEFGIAHPQSLGSRHQSYFERPDILQVEAREHPELNWGAWREAHLEAAAAFLELYPTEHLYFLARDAELLYDAVRLISRDDPQTLARLHLLNVSSTNMRHEHIMKYLAQEGFTLQRLHNDLDFQPIFIDTGFKGTIPRAIADYVPRALRYRLKTHLLISKNRSMPSLRSFLYPVNPAINGQSPSSMHDELLSYESISRATSRSDAYQQISGQWHPISDIRVVGVNEENAPERARHYQENLRIYLESDETTSTLLSRRDLWRKIRHAWSTLSEAQWIEYLKATLSQENIPRTQLEPVIRDFLEWAEKIGSHLLPGTSMILPTQIGLTTELIFQNPTQTSLITQHPEWAFLLATSPTPIPVLANVEQVSALRDIFNNTQNDEIRYIAMEFIANRLNQPDLYALAETLVKKIAEPTGKWVQQFFSIPSTFDYPALLRLAIDSVPSDRMHHLFQVLHLNENPELLRRAIEKASPDQMGYLTIDVFSHAYWSDYPELLELLIKKVPNRFVRWFSSFRTGTNDYDALIVAFAEHIFSQQHWANQPDLLRLVLHHASDEQMKYFARYVFSKPHWARHPELLRLAIERAPKQQLSDFVDQVLSQPHWANHPLIDLFREATQIKSTSRRRAFFRAQMRVLPPENSSVCEQAMLEP